MNRKTLIIAGVVGVCILGAGVAFAATTPQARTIRLNNPGALVKSNVAWLGKVTPGTDKQFEQFQTPLAGARAMIVNMSTHYDRGDTTPYKMCAGWTPDNVAAYAARVAGVLGVGVNEPVIWSATMVPLWAKAMADWESGVPYWSLDLFKQAWANQ